MLTSKATLIIVAVIAIVAVAAIVVIERPSAQPVAPATAQAPAKSTSFDSKFYSGKVDNSTPAKNY